MDRLLTYEERIRRAEDIAERRRNSELRISSESFSSRKDNTIVKKMFIQLLVSLLIYCGFYYTKNSNNENIKFIKEKVNSILQTDVDFHKVYTEVNGKLEWINRKNKEEVPVEENSDENKDDSNGNNEEQQNSEENSNASDESNLSENVDNNEKAIAENMGIGGENDSSQEDEYLKQENISQEDQMSIDAEYVKNTISLVNPLSSGIITSRFGNRESNEIVSANHKGIDLGEVTGKNIICSMEGIVTEASSSGDFGKHLKITNGEITTIYAHCSNLLVKQGDTVAQGQVIAKVGSTGKATGPHLHFEIRRENRSINPELILQFEKEKK